MSTLKTIKMNLRLSKKFLPKDYQEIGRQVLGPLYTTHEIALRSIKSATHVYMIDKK